MKINKKIFLGFSVLTIIAHSLFIPLALPGFVFCFGADGHVAIEPETAVQHDHEDNNFKTTIQTILTNKNYQYHSENCFDISLDRDNDYQSKHSKINIEFTWKVQSTTAINQEDKNDLFPAAHFFIHLNKFSPQPIPSLSTTLLLI